MSDIRQLADGNVGSSLSNGINGSEDESVPFGSLRNKKEVIVKKLQELTGLDLESKVICVVQKMIRPMVFRAVQDLIKPVLEPLMRRVVKEQIELAQEIILTSMNQDSAERLNSSQPRRLKLRFGNTLSHRITTGSRITGKDGTPVRVELVDENTGSIVKVGPEASSRVEITVFQIDPDGSGELNQVAVRERGGNKSLVMGDAYLNLNEGIGLVDHISFVHRSDWTRKCRLMLGARMMGENVVGVTEAKSEVFTLLDSRSKRHEKHHPPSIYDEVWRLENISPKADSAYNQRLMKENIKTVKDFLTEYHKNPQRLEEILQMHENRLNATLAHALNCKELEEQYVYYIPGSQQPAGIVFNIVRQLLGQICESHFIPINDMTEAQKNKAQELVASAFEHWGDVAAYNKDYPLRSSTQQISSPSNTIPSDSHIETCANDAGPDPAQSSTPLLSVDDRQDEMQPTTAPEGDINDSSHHSVGRAADVNDLSLFDITGFGVGFDFDFLELSTLYSSPTHGPDPWALEPGFDDESWFKYSSGSGDRLDHEESKAWIRKWQKMFFLLKFPMIFWRKIAKRRKRAGKRTRLH